MTSEPRRLLAVAISPLSYLGGAPPSAIEVVHNLRFTRNDGSAWRGEAKLRLSGDRSTLALSMRDSAIGRRAVEIWRLTDRLAADSRGEAVLASRGGFIVVILQRLQDAEEKGSLDLVFDLSQAATMSGCIDVGDLRRLGFNVADARQSHVEGMALGSAASDRSERMSPDVQQSPPAAPRRRSPAESGARRHPRRVAAKTRLQTGAFSTRRELTARIWALRRQQMFPNLAAIARECETTPDVVRVVIEKQEGLEGYLQTGCLLG